MPVLCFHFETVVVMLAQVLGKLNFYLLIDNVKDGAVTTKMAFMRFYLHILTEAQAHNTQ